jgi:zinc transporter ZupT
MCSIVILPPSAVALGLTLCAGLASGPGGLLLCFARRPNLALLSFGVGLSSCVMVYLSLVELLPAASDLLGASLGKQAGGWLATGCFFGGMLIPALIDEPLPEPENPDPPLAFPAPPSPPGCSLVDEGRGTRSTSGAVHDHGQQPVDGFGGFGIDSTTMDQHPGTAPRRAMASGDRDS